MRRVIVRTDRDGFATGQHASIRGMALQGGAPKFTLNDKQVMKPEELYQELKLVAERLGVTVEEHNFREAGVRVVSGLCVVHGKRLFIMDKHKSVQKKVLILSAALSEMPLDEVYIVPAVRDLIAKRADESLQEGG